VKDIILKNAKEVLVTSGEGNVLVSVTSIISQRVNIRISE